MQERFKKLTIELTDILQKQSLLFFMDKLEEEENMSDVINLIMSSFISAMMSQMRELADDNEDIKKKVNLFIAGLLAHIASVGVIDDIQVEVLSG